MLHIHKHYSTSSELSCSAWTSSTTIVESRPSFIQAHLSKWNSPTFTKPMRKTPTWVSTHLAEMRQPQFHRSTPCSCCYCCWNRRDWSESVLPRSRHGDMKPRRAPEPARLIGICSSPRGSAGSDHLRARDFRNPRKLIPWQRHCSTLIYCNLFPADVRGAFTYLSAQIV